MKLRDDTKIFLFWALVMFALAASIIGVIYGLAAQRDERLRRSVELEIQPIAFDTVEPAQPEPEVPSTRERLIALIDAFPRHATDRRESWADYHGRAIDLADAILHASETSQKAAELATIVFHETRFARYVAEDRCAEGPQGRQECDGGRALGVFQLGPSFRRGVSGPPSRERLRAEALEAGRALDLGYDRCDGQLLAGYRGPCVTSDDPLRRKTLRAFSNVLANGWPQAPTGYVRWPNPNREYRKRVLAACGTEHDPGTFRPDPRDATRGFLVEWHFAEFTRAPGAPAGPQGWHLGCSIFRIGAEVTEL